MLLPDDGRTLVSARTFPVPPRELYDAFADPVRLARWWGPDGCANRFDAFELRPGGRWHFTMRGPWGDLSMRKTFGAIEAARRVEVHHEQEGHTFTLEMRYDPVPGGTRLTWAATFATAAQLAAVHDAFARGNEQNFDRLERELRLSATGAANA